MKSRIQDYKRGVITREAVDQSLNSYLGVLSHANTFRVEENLKNSFWLEFEEKEEPSANLSRSETKSEGSKIQKVTNVREF